MKRVIKFFKICALLFCVIIMTLCTFSVFAVENSVSFAGGDGTESNPYQVATPEQLNEVRNHLDAYFIQINDIDLTEATAEGGIFDYDGSGWKPIGIDDKTAFIGNYDGGGYSVIGLKSNQSDSKITYAGLFGYNRGVIRNLDMVDGTVSLAISSTTTTAYAYAGGIAGYNEGTITNCYNAGAVSSFSSAVSSATSTSTANSFAGGIAGSNSGNITNCCNTSLVSSFSTGTASYLTASAHSYAGGIAGENKDSITNCYNMGTVFSDSSQFATYTHAHAGGIAGINWNGVVANCYNTGAVSTSSANASGFSPSYAGGIAGENNSTITSCYNTGTVAFLMSFSYNTGTGGIAGKNDGTVENCYHYDALNLKTEEGTSLSLEELKQQESYVGFDFETVWEFDHESGYPFPVLQDVKHINSKENTTEFAGGTGYLDAPYQVSTPEHLNNVRNHLGAYFIQTEDIDMTVATAEDGEFYNSGKGWTPIGDSYDMSFIGNYNGGGHCIVGLKCKQSGSWATYAGLFGYNQGVIRNVGMVDSTIFTSVLGTACTGSIASINNGAITNCYNTGSVFSSFLSSITSPAETYVGGIVGRNNGSITNCYNTGGLSVSSPSTDLPPIDSYSGGIAGRNDGSIINCYNTGAVSSVDYASGIAGINNHNTGSVINCYNTGAVLGGTSLICGIAYGEGIIENCYYHNAPNVSLYITGTPLSLEELKLQENYVGFDFDTIWSISPDINSGYPTLRGMPAPEDVPVNPSEPGDVSVFIDIIEKRYDSATGSYHLTVAVHNQGDKPLNGTVLVTAYDGNRLVANRLYSVPALVPDGTQTVSAEITTNGQVEQLKVFCWDMKTLCPLSEPGNAAG